MHILSEAKLRSCNAAEIPQHSQCFLCTNLELVAVRSFSETTFVGIEIISDRFGTATANCSVLHREKIFSIFSTH